MRQVNIREAKTHLSRLIEEARQGEEIVIARHGRPVARLVPVEQHQVEQHRGPRKLGRLKGQIHIADDFDDPLPDDIARAFGAKE